MKSSTMRRSTPYKLAAVILICAPVVFLACAQSVKKGKSMPSIQLVSPDDEVTGLDLEPTLIKSGPAPTLKAATPASGKRAYYRPFANDEMNSRLIARLPAGEWRVRWQADLDSDSPASFVLADGDRILVQAFEWRLFSLDGKPLAQDRMGLSPLAMDSPNGMFYFVDTDGYLNGRRLNDGGKAFVTLLDFSDEYLRQVLSRRGRKVAVGGYERPLDPHGHHKPSTSTIQVIDLGQPLKMDDTGLLESAAAAGALRIGTEKLFAALSTEKIVFAVPGQLHHANWDAQIKASFEGDFEPHALSLDELGNVYLAVTAGERKALWGVQPTGQRFLHLELPPPLLSGYTAPAVGYDHRVYIAANGQVASINPSGQLVWMRALTGKYGGCSITADNQLLVSDGPEIVAYNPTGERKLIFKCNELVLTPPVLLENGNLLAATANALYCLSVGR